MLRSNALLFLAGFSAVVGGFGTGWVALALLSPGAPAPMVAPVQRAAPTHQPAPSTPAAKPEPVRPGPTRIADAPSVASPEQTKKAAPAARKPDAFRVRLPFGEFNLEW